MNTRLININEFIGKISPKDDFKGIGVYLKNIIFFEKKANIKIYIELIQKMNNESFKIEITKEEKQKYEECLSYFTNEIKKAKESYQKNMLIKKKKLKNF